MHLKYLTPFSIYRPFCVFCHSIFPDVTLRGQNEERRFVCTVSRVLSGHCSVRSHLGRFRIVEDLMCVCAGVYETVDHLIWHCERCQLERHCLIDALAVLNVSIGRHIRDLCALKKDFLRGFGIKLWRFGPIWTAGNVFTRTLNGFGHQTAIKLTYSTLLWQSIYCIESICFWSAALSLRKKMHSFQAPVEN
jgi:hypothetical protein